MFILIFSLLISAIDIYTFKGLRRLISDWPDYGRYGFYSLYWLVPLILIGFMIYISHIGVHAARPDIMPFIQFVFGFFILFYLPKLVFLAFHISEDVVRLLAQLTQKWSPAGSAAAATAHKISRTEFLSRIGLFVAAVPFLAVANGIWRGRFDFTVRRQVLNFDNLPDAFDGLKVVQISDFHIGSFAGNGDEVKRAIDLINRQQADLLLFTGDMVNNVAGELDEYLPVLQKLEAPLGKFSILGNHDYGDYVRWNSAEAKRRNLEQLKGHHRSLGFRLLLNESLKLERDGQHLALIGVENWGLPPFPQYGDLSMAQNGTADAPFKILMSHDPTHWDAEVLPKTDIDLTLSGHTHGMQFGIEIPGWRWSPVNLRYRRWGGLYREGKQYLYVNTGIGFIAFPGRVGMPPEITVLELRNRAEGVNS